MNDKIDEFEVRSVSLIPKELEPGILYVSLENGVAIHLCACGCGEKTITPLNERWGWTLKFDGHVSLNPSIGNNNFPCKSHYFITHNKVRWC